MSLVEVGGEAGRREVSVQVDFAIAPGTEAATAGEAQEDGVVNWLGNEAVADLAAGDAKNDEVEAGADEQVWLEVEAVDAPAADCGPDCGS